MSPDLPVSSTIQPVSTDQPVSTENQSAQTKPVSTNQSVKRDKAS